MKTKDEQDFEDEKERDFEFIRDRAGKPGTAVLFYDDKFVDGAKLNISGDSENGTFSPAMQTGKLLGRITNILGHVLKNELSRLKQIGNNELAEFMATFEYYSTEDPVEHSVTSQDILEVSEEDGDEEPLPF